MVSREHFGDAINYVSIWDPIPFVCDPVGIIKSFFSDNIKVVFLTTRGYPIVDHMFKSESYQSAVNLEGNVYIKSFTDTE